MLYLGTKGGALYSPEVVQSVLLIVGQGSQSPRHSGRENALQRGRNAGEGRLIGSKGKLLAATPLS